MLPLFSNDQATWAILNGKQSTKTLPADTHTNISRPISCQTFDIIKLISPHPHHHHRDALPVIRYLLSHHSASRAYPANGGLLRPTFLFPVSLGWVLLRQNEEKDSFNDRWAGKRWRIRSHQHHLFLALWWIADFGIQKSDLIQVYIQADSWSHL